MNWFVKLSQTFSTLAQVKAIAAKWGAKVEVTDSGRYRTIEIFATNGKVWGSNFCHSLTSELRPGESKEWQSDVFAGLINDMRYGLDDCNETDCEICGEEF